MCKKNKGYKLGYCKEMPKKIRQKKKNISQKTYETLEHMIVFCEIEPKSILTEIELSELLKVSRTPIREALKKLSNEKLVEISKSGILVPDISVEIQLKLLRVRRVMERLCVECAVENASEKDIQIISDLIKCLEENDDDIVFLDYLRQIHHILSNAAKNEFVAHALNSVQGLSRRFWLYYAKKEDYTLAKNLHKNLLNCIIQKDLKSSLKASTNLVDYLENFAKDKLP